MQVSTTYIQNPKDLAAADILRNCDKIQHLKPNHEYVILEIHKVKTRYGLNYVLVDVDYNKYWSVSKVNKFIEDNKNTLEVLEIKTNNYIPSYKGNPKGLPAGNPKGLPAGIKILDLDCWNTPLKDIYTNTYDEYENY